VWDPHLAYRKTGLGHISTFFGRTMCMFGFFARKDGASRLIDIPKRTPTRFIPPLAFYSRVFGGCCLGQGESKIPPSNPHKDHAWHSALIIQCWPYSMSRRTPKFRNAVQLCVAVGIFLNPPSTRHLIHLIPLLLLLHTCANPDFCSSAARMSGLNEWTANLRFNVGSIGSSKDRTNCLIWSHRAYQSCHITEIFARTYQLVLTPWRLDFVI
jgi:hypothetical protein